MIHIRVVINKKLAVCLNKISKRNSIFVCSNLLLCRLLQSYNCIWKVWVFCCYSFLLCFTSSSNLKVVLMYISLKKVINTCFYINIHVICMYMCYIYIHMFIYIRPHLYAFIIIVAKFLFLYTCNILLWHFIKGMRRKNIQSFLFFLFSLYIPNKCNVKWWVWGS